VKYSELVSCAEYFTSEDDFNRECPTSPEPTPGMNGTGSPFAMRLVRMPACPSHGIEFGCLSTTTLSAGTVKLASVRWHYPEGQRYRSGADCLPAAARIPAP